MQLPVPLLVSIHGACMAVSWGLLLPMGVFIAHFERKNTRRVCGKPVWFGYHRLLQASGVVVQLVGFVAIFVHTQNTRGGSEAGHFAEPHKIHKVIGLSVAITGVLQPLNAVFRPHVEPGEEPSLLRRVWSRCHRSLGYGAVIGGFVNVCIGVYVAAAIGYEDAFIGLLGGIVGTSVVGFVMPYCYLRGYKTSGGTSNQVQPISINPGGQIAGIDTK